MNHVTVIAEAGVNHNGSLERAIEMVDVAADIGVDVVKFQTFNAEALVTRSAPKADYQKETTDKSETQLDMLRALELDEHAHRALIQRCSEKGVQFLSTPFDLDSLDLLANDLGVATLKVGSGELTNAPLLHACAKAGRDLILSTGMATLNEVETMLGVVAHGYLGECAPSEMAFKEAFKSEAGKTVLKSRVKLLHCTSSYPTPDVDVNLRAIETLRAKFDLPVGFSDHSEGIVHAIASVAIGACIIEKHYTLDKELPGPDHKASATPEELKGLVEGVRRVSAGLGDGNKEPRPAEISNMAIGRKSLVACKAINAGDIFTTENLTVKRPGTGLRPELYWSLLGTHAARAYAPDDMITQ
ncbi:N-acetylneuraminate synthase [Parvibaculaceae bacterium PLY_AMNH_Bact1]|nr:N-acetylneuraminate synthase [Parvibaculaceae bacterium PLY_AMNH_Bact1]